MRVTCFSVFFATVKGITYLCVVKLYRILQLLRVFSTFQFEYSVCSTKLKVSNTTGVAKLFSNYDDFCHFLKFRETHFTKFENPNPVVGCC